MRKGTLTLQVGGFKGRIVSFHDLVRNELLEPETVKGVCVGGGEYFVGKNLNLHFASKTLNFNRFLSQGRNVGSPRDFKLGKNKLATQL